MNGTSKPRARRVASDEAHAWARSLKLNNPYGKTVLRGLAIYCNGEGSCFVGIDQLALDTDLSTDTVRRRLVWLEEIGAIRRVPQYLDSTGRRNPTTGKRTTDEIVLIMDNDAAVEARAKGIKTSAESAEYQPDKNSVSPSREQPQDFTADDDQPSVSPRLALAVAPPPNPFNHEPESVADDARARDPLISKSALELAERLLIIAGHDPSFWPPGWCGAPMRVQTWLASGWTTEIIVAATRGAMARKTGPPPNSVQFFEKAIAEEVVRQKRPLPEVTHAVQANRKPHADRSTGAAYDRLRQRLNAGQDASGGSDGSGASAVPLLAEGRGSRS